MPDNRPICVLYCRVGNADQLDHEYSIDQQRRILLEYAKQMGYTCTAAYLDVGYSAHDTERPGFARLNADIAAGKVSVVLAKDPSRFWRDVVNGRRWWSRMDRQGVTVLCQDTPEFQQDKKDLQASFEGLYKRKKRKQTRHTVRMPPPPSKGR